MENFDNNSFITESLRPFFSDLTDTVITNFFKNFAVDKLPENLHQTVVTTVKNTLNTYAKSKKEHPNDNGSVLFRNAFNVEYSKTIEPICFAYLFGDSNAIPLILKTEILKALGIDEKYAELTGYQKTQLGNALLAAMQHWLNIAILADLTEENQKTNEKFLALSSQENLKAKTHLTIDNCATVMTSVMTESYKQRSELAKMKFAHELPKANFRFTRDELLQATNPNLQDLANRKEKRAIFWLTPEFFSCGKFNSMHPDYVRGTDKTAQGQSFFEVTEEEFKKKLEILFRDNSDNILKAYGQYLFSFLEESLLVNSKGYVYRAERFFTFDLYKKDDHIFLDAINHSPELTKDEQDIKEMVHIPGTTKYHWRFDTVQKQFQLEWLELENAIQVDCLYRDNDAKPLTRVDVEAHQKNPMHLEAKFYLRNFSIEQNSELGKVVSDVIIKTIQSYQERQKEKVNSSTNNFTNAFGAQWREQIDPACLAYLFDDVNAVPPILKKSLQKKFGIENRYTALTEIQKAQIANGFINELHHAINKKMIPELTKQVNNNEVNCEEIIRDISALADEVRNQLAEVTFASERPQGPYRFSRADLQFIMSNKWPSSAMGYLYPNFYFQPAKGETVGFDPISADLARGEWLRGQGQKDKKSDLEKIFGPETAADMANAFAQKIICVYKELVNHSLEMAYEVEMDPILDLYKKGDEIFLDVITQAPKPKEGMPPNIVYVPGTVKYHWRFDTKRKQFQLEWMELENALQACCLYRNLAKDPIKKSDVEEFTKNPEYFKKELTRHQEEQRQAPVMQAIKEEKKTQKNQISQFRRSLKQAVPEEFIQNEVSSMLSRYSRPTGNPSTNPPQTKDLFLKIVANLKVYSDSLSDKNMQKEMKELIKALSTMTADFYRPAVQNEEPRKYQQNEITKFITEFETTIIKKEKSLEIPRPVWERILIGAKRIALACAQIFISPDQPQDIIPPCTLSKPMEYVPKELLQESGPGESLFFGSPTKLPESVQLAKNTLATLKENIKPRLTNT